MICLAGDKVIFDIVSDGLRALWSNCGTKKVTKNTNDLCSLRRDSWAIWATVLDEFEDE